MNAIDFVKEYGLDYSKRVLEVAPKSANFVEWYPLRSRFYVTDVGCNRAVVIVELKQIVDAFDMVGSYGGLTEASCCVFEETGEDCYYNKHLEEAINLVEKCYE